MPEALGRRVVPVHCDLYDFDQIRVMYVTLDREFGRKGSIINMSSLGGVNALGRGNFAYSVAMGGVIQMTRELSTEWSGRGVRVNAIAPAQITNPDFEVRMDATPGLRQNFLRGIPMGRLGVPDDIKGLALFLASDASGFTTGTVVPLDGGNLAMNAGGTAGHKGSDIG